MVKIKYLTITIVATFLALSVCAKKDKTFRCHCFGAESDYYSYKTKVLEYLAGKPSFFTVFRYNPEDTINYIEKCDVRILNGIREEIVYLQDSKNEIGWKTGWYESTTEKVHNQFYKKIDKGYEENINIMREGYYKVPGTNEMIPHTKTEAMIVYRKIIKDLRNFFSEEEIKRLQDNQIPVISLYNDVDEKGRVIYWHLASSKSLRNVISQETFRKIAVYMDKVRFPKTIGLKRKYLDGSCEAGIHIYDSGGDKYWNTPIYDLEN